ncbi:oxidase ustYa family protein, partial [Aspergillus novofumigatus IBT 16806]
APVQDLVQYETRVFDSGFGKHTTKYMGPPDEENNKHWEDLYQAGISMIPIDKAAKLPVKTYPIPERPGYYVIGIDVFHQLHCLVGFNFERILYMDRNEDKDKDGLQNMDHLDHCIDSIRQSLMCSSDISTIVWVWDSASHKARPHANVTHTCRDFEAIRQWSLEHRAPVWNRSIFVPDPLRQDSAQY